MSGAEKKILSGENSRYQGQDITLAALMKVHYFPYLEHSNIPAVGTGNTQSEKSGYKKNRFMHQYTQKEVLRHAGERFDHIFQNKKDEAINPDLYRVFIMGNSFAYGFGVDASVKYYTHLDKELREQRNIHVIPASVSAINSTQENILFHMSVLPQRPNFVVFIDGWNDVMMPMIFSIRPGDPMTMSTLYRKYDQVFFNMLIRLCQKSKLMSRLVTKMLEKDRRDFMQLFAQDSEFRANITQSIINVYMHNLEIMIEGCRARGIKFIHMLQPCGDVLWEKYRDNDSKEQQESYQRRMSDYPWASLNLGPYLNTLFERIQKEIAKRDWASQSYDITSQFSLDHFFDPGHLSAAGHAVLKTKLKELIESKL